MSDTNDNVAQATAESQPTPAEAVAEATANVGAANVGTAEGAEAVSAVTEAKPETVTVGKSKKSSGTGDLIMDIASEVESLTKVKALHMAQNLSETVEVSYFKLGGVLKLIKENTWFDTHPDFDTFVANTYGFAARKAHYLIQIYTDLVTKQIPWQKVSHLGWTKLKELSPILTLENLDEWIAKAENLTVMELQAALKAKPEGESTAATTDDTVKMTFKFKSDQAAIVQTALAKAKAELNTEFDTVAMENICAGYVAGNVGVTTVDTSSLDGFIKSVDFLTLLQRVSELNPDWDITVDKSPTAA